jgi:hypothetical protein
MQPPQPPHAISVLRRMGSCFTVLTDGHYHICINYDDESVIPKVRCFIVPPSAI